MVPVSLVPSVGLVDAGARWRFARVAVGPGLRGHHAVVQGCPELAEHRCPPVVKASPSLRHVYEECPLLALGRDSRINVGTAWHAVGVPQQSPYGRVILVSGPEELLADRAVEAVIAHARGEDTGVEVVEVEAVRLDAAGLVELTGQSLFSSRRVAVVTDLAELATGWRPMRAGWPPSRCPTWHWSWSTAAAPGQGAAGRVRAVGARTWTARPRSRGSCRSSSRGGQAAGGAIEAARPGSSSRRSATICARWRRRWPSCSPTPRAPVTAAEVRRYFGGRAEVTSFAVADAALAGRTGWRWSSCAGRWRRGWRRCWSPARWRPASVDSASWSRLAAGCETPTWPVRSAFRRGS